MELVVLGFAAGVVVSLVIFFLVYPRKNRW